MPCASVAPSPATSWTCRCSDTAISSTSSPIPRPTAAPQGVAPCPTAWIRPSTPATAAPLEPYFERERMLVIEPRCRQIAVELVQALRACDEGDFVAAFAQPFSFKALCAFLGWPSAMWVPLRDWAQGNQDAAFSRDREAGAALAREFAGYVLSALQDRQRARHQRRPHHRPHGNDGRGGGVARYRYRQPAAQLDRQGPRYRGGGAGDYQYPILRDTRMCRSSCAASPPGCPPRSTRSCVPTAHWWPIVGQPRARWRSGAARSPQASGSRSIGWPRTTTGERSTIPMMYASTAIRGKPRVRGGHPLLPGRTIGPPRVAGRHRSTAGEYNDNRVRCYGAAEARRVSEQRLRGADDTLSLTVMGTATSTHHGNIQREANMAINHLRSWRARPFVRRTSTRRNDRDRRACATANGHHGVHLRPRRRTRAVARGTGLAAGQSQCENLGEGRGPACRP